jgi:hypothetical protein
VATLAVALVLAGCSVLPGRQFAFGFPARDGIPELRGVLEDKTGTVLQVTTIGEMAPVPPFDRGEMILGDGSVIAHWVDGCEQAVRVQVVHVNNTSIDIDITLQPRAGPCDLVGVWRYLRIRFAESVDLQQTSVDFTP